MSGKKLLILERSQANLATNTTDDGAIVLEGVFTEFGIRNKNNRIYEEKEVLPHINELKEKVKSGKLLGELDHPKDFDISLSNVSHVVESLDYDPEKKQVIGRIRLLNTSKGKEAQSLIKDGIPLHISSRAAGTVDESGKVKIKKFFTYDLVADPGFENAELSRVNESYGFDSDDTLIIYEMEETKNTQDKKEATMENQNNFVTVEDFQKYTEYVKGVLNNVKESSNSDSTEIVEKLVKYTEHIAEKVNQLSDYAEYLSENLDKSISFSDYLAENVNQIKKYTTYLAEELDSTIQYAEHVAEKADQGIQYTEHVAEKADKGIQYANYLRENLERSIEYSEYVAEKVDQGIAYSEHIAEGLNKTINYAEYIAENVNTEGNTAINEAEIIKGGMADGMTPQDLADKHKLPVSEIEAALSKGQKVEMEHLDNPDAAYEIAKDHIFEDPKYYDKLAKMEESKSYEKTIEEKLSQLIAKAENKVVSEMHFMNFLSESKKNEFNSLSEDKQKLIVESMNAKPIMSTSQAENIWESAFIEKKRELNFIDDMPEKYQVKWASLSESRQQQIIAESKFHSLNTPYAINNFWATRDLRPSQFELEKINEGKTAGEQADAAKKEPIISESYAAELINRVKFNIGR